MYKVLFLNFYGSLHFQITVPCQLTALMSARLTQKEVAEDPNNVVFKFEQNIPIPSYLVALVIGALDCR